MPSILLTPAQAAEELAISIKQLRQLARAGAISYINVGIGVERETRRYDRADVAAFIEARRVRVKPAVPRLQRTEQVVHDFAALHRSLREGRKRK